MTRLVSTVCLLFLTSLSFAADWPQWLGPRRDGGSSEAVVPWSVEPKVVWSAKLGAGFSCPVVAGGKVFVHARVANKQAEEMIAFEAKTGQVLWRTSYNRSSYSSVLNTGPQATPLVAAGRVYSFGITGVLTCFDSSDGKIVWQVDALKKLGVNVPRFGVCCSPVLLGNRLIVAIGGKGSGVVAFDSKTGEVAWQELDEQANTSSPVIVTRPGRALPDVVFMTNLRVVGLNPIDGSVSWEFPLPFQPSGTSPTPLLGKDLIVTSTMSNGSTGIRLSSDGDQAPEQLWQGKDLSGYFSTGVVASDRVFLVTNTLQPVPRADLVCVDAQSGKVAWKQEGVGYFHFGMIRTANDKLLVLDDSGVLKLLDSKASAYKELCQAKICDGTLVTPALSEGRVFARDSDKIVCVELPK